jgi:hypothetical protein
MRYNPQVKSLSVQFLGGKSIIIDNNVFQAGDGHTRWVGNNNDSHTYPTYSQELCGAVLLLLCHVSVNDSRDTHEI